MTGASVCRMHGGSSPNLRAKIEAEKAEAVAQESVRRIIADPDAPPVIDPFEALARLAGRIEAAADEVGQRVNDLRSVGIITVAGGEQLRAEVRLWDILLGHLRGALKDLIAAGFMERRQQIAEAEAETWGLLVAVALDAAGATGPARDAGITAARDRLAVIYGEPA